MIISTKSQSPTSAAAALVSTAVVSFCLLCSFFLGGVLGQQLRLSSGNELAALYSLRGSLGIQSRDWPRKADPCSAWTGVQCQGGRVVRLDLTRLRRTRAGNLNRQFAVDGLQNLTRLEFFNSTGFELPGSIPDWFGSRLPSTLRVLDLRRCKITGNIPPSLGNLVGISSLHLSSNSLAGNIPSTIGQLKNLTFLDLSSNGLTGSIPAVDLLLNLTALDLSSNYLSGPVPPSLGILRNLKTLSLSRNSLSGSIPAALGDLSSLVTIDLSVNSLSGPIPADLKNLRSLQVMEMSNNSLTGTLSESMFLSLRQLLFLSLSSNNISGALPVSLWTLPELHFIDVSYNRLTGILPDASVSFNVSGAVFNLSHNLCYGDLPSGLGKHLQRLRIVDISYNYFEGDAPFDSGTNVSVNFNCFRNASSQRNSTDCSNFYSERRMSYDGPGSSTPGGMQPPSKSSSRENKKRLVYILVGVFGGLLLVALVVLVLILCLRSRGAVIAEQKEESPNGVIPGGNVPLPPSMGGIPPSAHSAHLPSVGDSFTYAQLLKATSDFSDTNLIRKGHSGDFYHGTLESGAPVVVKRVLYPIELDFFARASHTRLVPFLGHCLEDENYKLLVYKYMPNKDLSMSLYRETGHEEEGMRSLDWITRQKIAIGVAEALCYLHHECVPPLVHRDIQASSVLLDDKFEVRLGSLSEACTQENEGHQNIITRLLRPSSSSEPSTSDSPSAMCAYDVYCFGKVLLELVTGKLGISSLKDSRANELLDQTLPYINVADKELLMKIIDSTLIVDEDLVEEVWAMAIVAKSCLNPKPLKRPPMRYILKALENPLKVVRDDSISGSARLRATSSRGSWNMAFFGSWRSSSDIVSVREVSSLKHANNAGSHASGGEQSLNHRRQSNEIFPEPASSPHYDEV